MNPEVLIPIVSAAINGATQLTTLVLQIANHLQQSGELTPEQEKALDDKIAALKSQPWWQPDAQ